MLIHFIRKVAAMAKDKISEYKDYIKNSHERCKNSNIKLNQMYSNKILNEIELFEKLEANRELILAAAPIMSKIYDFVKGSDFFSILTDKDGCILNVIGDENILTEAFSFKMIPGAYMNENNIGTNAMGTCIAEKKPLQVSGNEHFIKAYHRWTCSASPIKDADGNIIGILDLTGYSENVHLHTLGIVITAASAIEKELSSNIYKAKLFDKEKYYEVILNTLKIGVMVSDLNGNIISANSSASELFGYNANDIISLNAKDIIRDWKFIKKSVLSDLSEKNYFNDDVDIFSLKNILQLNLSAHPVKNQDGKIISIILLFNEISKSRKQTDMIKGRHAIYTFDKIIGRDANFLTVINFAKKVANSKSTILITGESGTGKELFAQSIHNYSKRSKEPFVALNCGAIPRDLIESELFGYEEGAFTGAKTKGNSGKFEIADGGTIFLDEIGEMPFDLQTRLLRVIEEGTVSRIGSSHEKVVNVRIIAATNKDLKKEVENGKFRKDLFYRLNVLPLRLPSLKERKEDIKLLIEYFMSRISKKLNKREILISDKQMQKLVEYDWPGNVRELENYIELIINAENVLDIYEKGSIEHFEQSENIIKNQDEQFLSLKEIESYHILKVLNLYENNITKAATVLGIGRNTLYRKMKELNMTVS